MISIALEDTAHDKPSSTGGAGASDDDGTQKESHGTGTGEKYVKSSGMSADGGDFDAAKPGAGKEADRLLETKGIHHSSVADSKVTDSKESSKEDIAGAGKEGKEKRSLKEKIKAKLHRS